MKNKLLGKEFFIEMFNAIYKLLKKHSWTILILLIYTTIFSLISFVNHYNFRTGAYDLGIYNNTIYDYSRLKWNDNPVMHVMFDNILSDHFNLLLIFFAPFRYIFGTYTLLIFQILAICFGSLGAYKFVLTISDSKLYGRLAIIHYLSTWGIYSALSFHYHDNVVGAMFVPWLLYFFYNKNWKYMWIMTALVLISKEYMPLWLIFIFIGLFLWKIKDKKSRNASLLGIVISALYFVTIMGVIMPSLANEGRDYAYFSYKSLGKTPGEALLTIYNNPQKVFSLLFENPGKSIYDGIKTELHYVVLISGGIAIIYKPQFLIMLLPIYAQKLFNDSYGKWGLNNHYSIEFTAILTIAFFYWVIKSPLNKKYKTLLLIAGTLICIHTTKQVIEERKSKWYTPLKTMFYHKAMYKQTFDVDKIYQYLKEIPKDAKVCAQSSLLPHIAFRDYIYTYPHIRDSEYIVLLPGSKGYWPFRKNEYFEKLNELKNDSCNTIIIDDKDFLLIKRK